MDANHQFLECYDPNCAGCKRSQGKDDVIGGIIGLTGEWTLNHLGDANFLGWMALQPRCHRMELADLTTGEAAALGCNIQAVEKALRDYWLVNFSDDPIHRVYVVYFFESVFDRKPTTFHLHIHLIPRTKLFGNWLQNEDDSGIIAWDIYKIGNPRFGLPALPERYKRTPENVIALMDQLRKNLKGELSEQQL